MRSTAHPAWSSAIQRTMLQAKILMPALLRGMNECPFIHLLKIDPGQ
jgi:hypothetical protein